MNATPEFKLAREDFVRFQRLAGRRLRARAGVAAATIAAKVVLWMLIASSMF